ncbi:SCO2525 family SAM-dependent methyltransferase [Catellatospora citrea]|nr:SCO2525 family SAM-dependent methyltransferase [Catellatospora citrea]
MAILLPSVCGHRAKGTMKHPAGALTTARFSGHAATAGRRTGKRRYNADFDWDQFNSDWYRAHNYLSLRDDDTAIMTAVGEFFQARLKPPAVPLRGLDVGSGANLYPAMSMLPHCKQIDLREFSRSNVRWLSDQLEHYDPHWDDFWNVYRRVPAYRSLANPREAMRKAARVERMSIFDLPEHEWDMGTMFFVAESLTYDPREFWRAVGCFVRALKPGAPFAAAFMADSQGYKVDKTQFPAVAVGIADVEDCLSVVAEVVGIDMVQTKRPLRRGYGGMILATGVALS